MKLYGWHGLRCPNSQENNKVKMLCAFWRQLFWYCGLGCRSNLSIFFTDSAFREKVFTIECNVCRASLACFLGDRLLLGVSVALQLNSIIYLFSLVILQATRFNISGNGVMYSKVKPPVIYDDFSFESQNNRKETMLHFFVVFVFIAFSCGLMAR